MAKQVSFLNLSVNSVVKDALAGEYEGITEHVIITEFIEGLDAGLKFSMSAPEGKSATCVSLTLPHYGHENESICSTFWGDEPFDALFEAFIVYRHFEAERDGLYNAKARMVAYQKKMVADLRRFLEEGNTPIKQRLVE